MNKIRLLMVFISFFAIGCEKENGSSVDIKIETGKNTYAVNSKIDISLKNGLNRKAHYFTCDNVDLYPDKILKKENGVWVISGYAAVCTMRGPMGYFGLLDIAETRYDTISLVNEIGKFKLIYRFIADKDTFDFASNEFSIY